MPPSEMSRAERMSLRQARMASKSVQAGLGFEIERRRSAPETAENGFGELGRAERGEIRGGLGVSCVGLLAHAGFALERGEGILADGRRIERNFETGIGLLAARNGPEQNDGVSFALEVRGDSAW